MTCQIPWWRDDRGSAAIEMALVTPIFLVLMFGAFDLGNYFMSEHAVLKAVRDGARYASHRGFADYDCATLQPIADVTTKTRNVTRTGAIASGGTPRLSSWTDDSTIIVSITCPAIGTYGGIYTGSTKVPVVKVTAAVPYTSLFKKFGLTTSTITLNAASQIPVMGA